MIFRLFIALIFSSFFFLGAKSQSKLVSDSVFTYCETMPEYPGGKQKMMQHITSKTYFPVNCKKENIIAKITVSFVIDTMGKVQEVEFAENIPCEEFVTVLKDIFYSMPDWNAGVQDGKKVKVKFSHPIYINIE